MLNMWSIRLSNPRRLTEWSILRHILIDSLEIQQHLDSSDLNRVRSQVIAKFLAINLRPFVCVA